MKNLPTCGASLAVVYDGCDFLQDKTNIVVIVCGGVGVTLRQLKDWRLGLNGRFPTNA